MPKSKRKTKSTAIRRIGRRFDMPARQAEQFLGLHNIAQVLMHQHQIVVRREPVAAGFQRFDETAAGFLVALYAMHRMPGIVPRRGIGWIDFDDAAVDVVGQPVPVGLHVGLADHKQRL